jgi:hypothetical protein
MIIPMILRKQRPLSDWLIDTVGDQLGREAADLVVSVYIVASPPHPVLGEAEHEGPRGAEL